MFLITGYVPEDRAAKLERDLEEKCGVFVEFSDPSEDEDVPVVLHNNKFVEPVEGIVESYSLPGKGELDPSAVMAGILLSALRSDAVGCGLRADHGVRLPVLL